MNGINTNTFSHRNYFPARQYAAAFFSPPDGDTAINTLPTGSFFQADQHQIKDQINSDSSVLSIADYAVKRFAYAYLTITRLWQLGGFYPASLGPTQQTILKPQSPNRGLQLTKPETSIKEVNMSKNKTTRDTSFSKSSKLIKKNGKEAIRELGEQHGMYGAAERLNASPYVIRYIAHKNEGTRDASNANVQHLVKAVQNGRAKASDFKSLDFSNVQVNHKSINGGNSNEKR